LLERPALPADVDEAAHTPQRIIVIRNFVADLDLTMALAGCKSVAGITRDTVVSAPR
jgi:isopentenyl diphosphate isomerase/L-lactate dehydrogenase-like FMN-dependent dehydrogenase